MSKALHLKSVRVPYPFGIELYDTTGMPADSDAEGMLLAKLDSSCGKTRWHLIHLN